MILIINTFLIQFQFRILMHSDQPDGLKCEKRPRVSRACCIYLYRLQVHAAAAAAAVVA